MTDDRLAAELAEIREELESSALLLRHGTDPGARLLAAAGLGSIARIALGAVEMALKLADDARPSLSAPPADCSNACERGECDCSGVMRALAWSLDPGELRAGILAALTGKDPS